VGLLVLAVPARAPAAEDSVGGTVDPRGVTITIVRWNGSERVHATGAGGGEDPTGCDWAVIPPPLAVWPPADLPPEPPGSHLGLLTCNGAWVEVIWVGPHNTVDLGVEARRAVERYVARVPVPRVEVHPNPRPSGLVGLPSWFWLSGYDGEPIVDRIEALGVQVDVHLEPTPVTWAFGDGQVVDAGLGRAYPARSDVRHTYTTHGTTTVRADLALVPRYRIDGTEWLELPGIALGDQLRYRVLEAQAVIGG
jgi:hypothetical protein